MMAVVLSGVLLLAAAPAPTTGPGGAPARVENKVGIHLARIAPGTFMMGSTGTEIGGVDTKGVLAHQKDELLHKVTLTKGFFMAAELVTVDQFKTFIEETGYQTEAERQGYTDDFDPRTGRVMHANGRSWKNCGFEQKGDHPVTCVTQNDALAFCKWLKSVDGHAYRLPTEAEWEYCCRAGTTMAYFWGDKPADGKGFINGAGKGMADVLGVDAKLFEFDDGYVHTSPVSAMKENPWHLHDMLGNVWQWTSSYYAEYPKEEAVDPDPLPGKMGIAVRGGSWGGDVYQNRAAYRSASPPEYRNNGLGFRVAADLF